MSPDSFVTYLPDRSASAEVKCRELSCELLFEVLDFLVDQAPLPSDVERQIVRVTDEQDGGDAAAPCESHLKVDVWIGTRQVRDNQRGRGNPLSHPIHDIARECRQVSTLTKEPGRVYSVQNAVVIDVIHVLRERHCDKDVGL